MPRGTLFHRATTTSKTLLPKTTMDTPISKHRRRTTYPFDIKQIVLITSLILVPLLIINHFHSTSHYQQRTWHGGHPAQERSGSCWCGDEDGYCMCTPALSVDIVLYERRRREGGDEEGNEGYNVWVVKRKDTGQFGTIGGFVEVGETPPQALLREVEEETGIIIPPHLAQAHGHNTNKSSNQNIMRLIGVYSDPRRDNRRSNVSTSYALQFDPSIMSTKDGSGIPKAGDDDKEVISIPMEDIGTKYKGDDWFADHLTILLDFKEQLKLMGGEGGLDRSGLGELAEDVSRSTCF